MIKIGINGFGRIGRLAFRAAICADDIEVVAVNAPDKTPEQLAYTVKYDSVHGRFNGTVDFEEGENPALIVNGKRVALLNNRDAKLLPWGELGVEYVEVAHNSGDTDMTTQLMNLQAAGVDAVILWTDDAEDVVTARQAYELGLDIPFITSAGVVMQQVLDQMEPEYVEGWYSATDFVPANDDPVVKTFVETFNAKYGIDPELYASAYYGAVKALAAAIEIAGSTDHEAVNDALTQIKDLPAPTGTMTYGAHGNMIHSLVITQIHDLKPSVVSTVSMDTN